jgi:hypothetical protein
MVGLRIRIIGRVSQWSGIPGDFGSAQPPGFWGGDRDVGEVFGELIDCGMTRPANGIRG